MKWILWSCILVSTGIFGQHQPKNWAFGLNAAGHLSNITEVGGSFHVDYAPTCFSTYSGEFGLFSYKDQLVPEINITINSMLYNFDSKAFITGGMGLMVNSAELSKREQDNAVFDFSNGQTNFGAIIKLRGLIVLSQWWQFSTELNLKSVGGNFSTVTFGIVHELPIF